MSRASIFTTLFAVLAIAATADAGPFTSFEIEIDGVVIFGAEGRTLPTINEDDVIPPVLPWTEIADQGADTITALTLLPETDVVLLGDGPSVVVDSQSPVTDLLLETGDTGSLVSSGFTAPEPAAMLQLLLGGCSLAFVAQFLRVRRAQALLAE
jgi:hypothetical protein